MLFNLDRYYDFGKTDVIELCYCTKDDYPITYGVYETANIDEAMLWKSLLERHGFDVQLVFKQSWLEMDYKGKSRPHGDWLYDLLKHKKVVLL